MTTILEHPTPVSAPTRRAPSRFARWWGGWRVAIRLARRDAWRGKGRALLVILLIALPVAAVTTVDVYARAQNSATSLTARTLRTLGTAADARVSLGQGGPVIQAPIELLGDAPNGPPPTKAEVVRTLPAGSRLVSEGQESYVFLEAGEWGVAQSVLSQDTKDAVIAGLWKVQSGQLPQTRGEIALSTVTATRLHVGVGGSVGVTLSGRGQLVLAAVTDQGKAPPLQSLE